MTRKAAKRNPVARALRLLGRRVKPSGKLYRRGRAWLAGLALLLVLLPLSLAAEPYEPLTLLDLDGHRLVEMCEHYPDRCIAFIDGVSTRLQGGLDGTWPLKADNRTDCHEATEFALISTCEGVIAAEWVLEQLTARHLAQQPKLCIPAQATFIAKAFMVQLYGEAHPQHLTEQAGWVVFEAMQWGFQCPAHVAYHTP